MNHARISNIRKDPVNDSGPPATCCFSASMRRLKRTENYTNRRAVNSPPRNPLTVNGYFTALATMSFAF